MNKFIISLAITASLSACGETDKNTQHSEQAAKTSHLETQQVEVKHSSGSTESCLVNYLKEPCELLSKKALTGLYPALPDDTLPEEQPTDMSCTYNWDSGGRTTTMKIGERDMNVPIDNNVSISWFNIVNDKNPVAAFKYSYRALSKEELKKIAEVTKQTLEEKSEEMSATQKTMVSEMTSGLGRGMHYTQIAGISSAAAWGSISKSIPNSLMVLDQNVKFEVNANVSDVENVNKDLAIAIAKHVVSTCQ